MSNGTVISVENLGKLYSLNHQVERQRYISLRDVLAKRLRGLIGRRDEIPPKPETKEDFWALKNVNFEIKQGEVVGIIGRNGAGKSTLLKILSRITEPSEGRVRIKGRVSSLLEVGTGFHPELTGRENISLNGAILGMTRAEIKRKFDEIVAFAEVERFLDTPVKHYSSGMYVRLAFAVAAHLEPEILVVDEVLAVGDSQFQNKCLGKMQEVSKGGRTVLFVSHNMAAVQSLCGTGILLESGRLCDYGQISMILRRYSAGLLRVAGIDEHNATALGPSLRLNRLCITPTPVKSGGRMSLCLHLVANHNATIKEFSVLIYSEAGVRVAILDLRREGLWNYPIHTTPLILEIHLKAVPLVEGEYRIGLYIKTNDYERDFLDLAVFTVVPSAPHSDVIPYLPQYRGFVEIGFKMGQLPSYREQVSCITGS